MTESIVKGYFSGSYENHSKLEGHATTCHAPDDASINPMAIIEECVECGQRWIRYPWNSFPVAMRVVEV